MLIELWGCDVWIVFSGHAFDRVDDRDIVMELIPNDIKSAEDELGNLKVGDKFVIKDTFSNITVVGIIKKSDLIKIITIVDKGKDFIAKNVSDIIIELS
ncbi:hypothetical protein [Thermoanaerobacterium butyriciformans]|uniref:Uncharacterized protein n=1 Tax=Thermoanaerobacterium butyriciformans TaxID=1702242 RepID=A0ABS4NAT5_9THEO|nr:hypothetical protein [Thermoanaerobacterium butyriciformans]MBP2070754.1 hypothetical protein [Thermoanaerobacterium butyriciformans]